MVTDSLGSHRTTLLILILPLSLLIAGCAGAAFRTPTSWPGLASDGEKVYLAFGEAVYAIDAASGRIRWQYPSQPNRGTAFYAPPAIAEGGLVIAGSFSNTLIALHANDGSIAWGPIGLPDGDSSNERIVGGPVVAGEVVLVPSTDGRLYARNVRDGSKVWTYPDESEDPIPEALWASPLVDGDRIYLPALDHRIYAIDLALGQALWPEGVDLSGAIADTPAPAGGLLLTGTFANKLVALNAANGRQRWSFATPSWVWGSPTVDGERAYFGDLAGRLYAVSVSNGGEIWRIQADSPIAASPLLRDGKLYAVTEGGSLMVREAESSSPIWQDTLEGPLLTDPLIVGDTLLVAANGGPALLTAYDAETGTVQWTFGLEP